MKIKISTLKDALNKIGVFVDQNSTIPACKTVHFSNKGNKASIFATDTCHAGRVFFDTEEKDAFDFCVNYKDMCRCLLMRGDEVELTRFSDRKMPNGDTADGIDFKSGRTKVACVEQKFDELKKVEEKCQLPSDCPNCAMNVKILKKAFTESKFGKEKNCTPQDPWIGGVHLKADGDSLYIEATNRSVVSAWKSPQPVLEGMEMDKANAIMMDKGINALMKYNDDENVSIYFDDGQIVMASKSMEAYTRSINAVFPDTSPLFKHEVIAAYEIDLAEAKSMLKQFDDKTFDAINLSFHENEVEFFSSENNCSVNDAMPCTRISGDDQEVCLTTTFLHDIVNNISGQKLRIEFLSKGKNNILSYVGEDGSYGLLSPRKRAR